jgi:hypothetical protein
MNDTVEVPAGEAAAVEVKEPKLANIVRGVIPHTLVYAIRFLHADKKEAELAKMFGTTTGKVADIRKLRNFGYITEDFLPTQEQKDQAIAWLKQVPDYDTVGTDAAVTEVEKLGIATAEQAAAFLEGRRASRNVTPKAPKEPAAEGEAAEAKPAKAPKAKKNGSKAEAAPASDADLDSLLS